MQSDKLNLIKMSAREAVIEAVIEAVKMSDLRYLCGLWWIRQCGAAGGVLLLLLLFCCCCC